MKKTPTGERIYEEYDTGEDEEGNYSQLVEITTKITNIIFEMQNNNSTYQNPSDLPLFAFPEEVIQPVIVDGEIALLEEIVQQSEILQVVSLKVVCGF